MQRLERPSGLWITSMFFAQAMAEYGVVAGIVAAAENALVGAQTWIEQNPTPALVVVGALILIGLLAMRLRSSRM